MTIKDQFELARKLIQAKKFDDARQILRKINHPKAQEWLNRLDEIDPSISFPSTSVGKSKTYSNIYRYSITGITFMLLISIFMFAYFLLKNDNDNEVSEEPKELTLNEAQATADNDPTFAAKAWFLGVLTSDGVLQGLYTCNSDTNLVDADSIKQLIDSIIVTSNVYVDENGNLVDTEFSDYGRFYEVDITNAVFEVTDQDNLQASVHLSGELLTARDSSFTKVALEKELQLVFEGNSWKVCQLSYEEAQYVETQVALAQTQTAIILDRPVITSENIEQITRLRSLEHGVYYAELEFSPSGKYLAIAGGPQDYSQTVIWDIENDILLNTIVQDVENCQFSFRKIVFTPDNRFLLGVNPSNIYVYDLTAGTCNYREFRNLSIEVLSTAVSPDSQKVSFGTSEGEVYILSLPKLITEKTFNASEKGILSVAYNSDGNLLAVASDDQLIKIWDSSTWNLIYTITIDRQQANGLVIFSKDGSSLIYGDKKQIIMQEVFPPHHKRFLTLRSNYINASDFTLSPDGALLILITTPTGGISSMGGYGLHVWDLVNDCSISCSPIYSLPTSGLTALNNITISPNGAIFITSYSESDSSNIWGVLP